ncbi:hypothetical protein PUR61_03260 [Streptomyces sp. BE20]|uniref:hypothetical protein n=1 Tax=Streptomyces sp. BE20 TaxID=3002525 RepID=UPI002E764CED|nr:hypothetical protein [Streptomyces sp. BE20]MEE1821221.1 hypothetical protein [Streptomyces sp. BE20]
MNATVTVTADPAGPEEMGAAAVTAITETLKAAAAKRPPVDRRAPWRIEGTPYSAARLTVGDLAARITRLPDHLLVVCGVPQWNRRAAGRCAPPPGTAPWSCTPPRPTPTRTPRPSTSTCPPPPPPTAKRRPHSPPSPAARAWPEC